MKPSIPIKPEPLQAQPNWSYQAYFLKQRQQQAGEETSNSIKVTPNVDHHQQVIARMKELAASINVQITIIPPTSAASDLASGKSPSFSR